MSPAMEMASWSVFDLARHPDSLLTFLFPASENFVKVS
jgi:hypothetical protein